MEDLEKLCFLYVKSAGIANTRADHWMIDRQITSLKYLHEDKVNLLEAEIMVYGNAPEYENCTTLICKITAPSTEIHAIPFVALISLHETDSLSGDKEWKLYARTTFNALIPLYAISDPPLFLFKQDTKTEYFDQIKGSEDP